MAQTLGEFLSLVHREVSDFPADVILAREWLQQRFSEVCERIPFNFLLRETVFNTTAEITAGTVTVTNGSATVTETTSNANGWTPAVENRYFRVDGDSEFYLISTFTDANPDTLTLARNYEGTTGTVIGYTIFQRLYTPATDIREIVKVSRLNPERELIEVTQSDLDITFPARPTLGEPNYWANAGLDTNDNQRIELYPIPDESKGILIHYIQETPSLADADATIFPQISYGLLKSGWMADYWNWRSARVDAPQQAILMSQQFEREFEKRLAELVLRESSNIRNQRIRLSSKFFRHRIQRDRKFNRNVELEII